MHIFADHYLDTLLIAECKDGRGRFVRGFSVGRGGTYSVELTEVESEAIRLASGCADSTIQELHRELRSDDDESIQFFRAIPVTRTWKATYRAKPTARRTKTIVAFFARTREDARRNALRVVDDETDGQGVLVSVEMTADPRN